MVNKNLCGRSDIVYRITLDIEEIVDYFFQELMEEGYVPTEDELNAVVDIAVNWTAQILNSVDVEVVFKEEVE